MISFPESICSLCSQLFARELLHKHMASEAPRLRRSTIEVIRAYHPGWVEDHGACEPCWRSYRGAGQILSQMRSAKPQNATGYRNPLALAAKGHDQDQTGRHDAY